MFKDRFIILFSILYLGIFWNLDLPRFTAIYKNKYLELWKLFVYIAKDIQLTTEQIY